MACGILDSYRQETGHSYAEKSSASHEANYGYSAFFMSKTFSGCSMASIDPGLQGKIKPANSASD